MRSIIVLGLSVFMMSASQAERTYLTVDGAGGVPLNVVTAGDPQRPAIFFIHGIGQSHYSFIHQLESDLAEDYYLVAFDLRAHGNSGKPAGESDYADTKIWAQDIRAVMEATHIENPIVVAWSYGTIVLMDYIREYGTSRLRAINMIGALGGLLPMNMPPADDPAVAAFLANRVLQASPSFEDNYQAAQNSLGMLTAEEIHEPYRQQFISISLMFPSYARRAMASHSLDNTDLIDKVDIPVLLTIGAHDNPVLMKDGTLLAEQRANYSASVYEDAGHTVFFEDPARFNLELREFADRSNTASAGQGANR